MRSNLIERFNAEIKEDEIYNNGDNDNKKLLSAARIIENFRINEDISKAVMIKLLGVTLLDYRNYIKGTKELPSGVWDNYIMLYTHRVGVNGRSIDSYEKMNNSKNRYRLKFGEVS